MSELKAGDVIEYQGNKWIVDRIEGDMLHLRRFHGGKFVTDMVGKTVYQEYLSKQS